MISNEMTSVPHDNSGAKLGHRRSEFTQHRAGFLAALEMKRDGRSLRGQSSQIDDPLYPGLFCRDGEIARRAPVALFKARRAAAHRVNQVIRHFDSLQRRRQSAGVKSIGLDDARASQTVAESGSVPHHAGDFVSALQQVSAATGRQRSRSHP